MKIHLPICYLETKEMIIVSIVWYLNIGYNHPDGNKSLRNCDGMYKKV